MCAPLFETDELPDLPEPEKALAALYHAELARLRIAFDLERGKVIARASSRDAEARLERLSADVQQRRIELEQAIIGQANGKPYIGRTSPTLVVEAMQARLRQNVSVQAVEARAARPAITALVEA